MVRRRSGRLLPIEVDILEGGIDIQAQAGAFHGFALAKRIAQSRPGSALTAHGTLYKALGRLTERGLLQPEWEDASVAEAEGRPRRHLYRVTGVGEAALAEERRQSVAQPSSMVVRTREGLA
jgi:PadR family transcriptional regulator, regulatory protein PadR